MASHIEKTEFMKHWSQFEGVEGSKKLAALNSSEREELVSQIATNLLTIGDLSKDNASEGLKGRKLSFHKSGVIDHSVNGIARSVISPCAQFFGLNGGWNNDFQNAEAFYSFVRHFTSTAHLSEVQILRIQTAFEESIKGLDALNAVYVEENKAYNCDIIASIKKEEAAPKFARAIENSLARQRGHALCLTRHIELNKEQDLTMSMVSKSLDPNQLVKDLIQSPIFKELVTLVDNDQLIGKYLQAFTALASAYEARLIHEAKQNNSSDQPELDAKEKAKGFKEAVADSLKKIDRTQYPHERLEQLELLVKQYAEQAGVAISEKKEVTGSAPAEAKGLGTMDILAKAAQVTMNYLYQNSTRVAQTALTLAFPQYAMGIRIGTELMTALTADDSKGTPDFLKNLSGDLLQLLKAQANDKNNPDLQAKRFVELYTSYQIEAKKSSSAAELFVQKHGAEMRGILFQYLGNMLPFAGDDASDSVEKKTDSSNAACSSNDK